MLATALWLVLDRSYLTGDSAWALVWGSEIANGELPSFESPFAPRTHPFATGLGFLLSPLGEHAAETALFALCFVALAFLIWAVYQAGTLAFSWQVGAFAAVAVATSFPFLSTTGVGSLDVVVVALVLAAAVLELRSPRCGVPVLLLLAVAGLQRPEAWVLSGVYVLYLLPGLDAAGRIRALALASAAPLVWLASGLIVTGDPLFSFTETLKKDVVTPSGQREDVALVAGNGLRSVFDVFRATLRLPVMAGAVLGLALALAMARRRSLVLAALAAAGTIALVLLAFNGVYLSARYALPAAAAFAVFCGFFTFGWTTHEGPRLRWIWATGACALLVALLVSAPAHVNRLQDLQAQNSSRARIVSDLRDLTRRSGFASIAARCGRVLVPNEVPVPYLVRQLDRRPTSFEVPKRADTGPAALIAPRGAASRTLKHVSLLQRDALRGLRAGAREAAGNRSWRLLRRNC